MGVIVIGVAVALAILAIVGAHVWALVASLVAMTVGVRRLTGIRGHDDLDVARVRGRVLLDAPWKRAAWIAGALAVAASVQIRRSDPSLLSTVLWVLAIACAIAAGVEHDRGTRPLRRIAADVMWQRSDTIAVLGLTIVAFALRVHRLDGLLPVVHGDEGEMGLLARLALEGPATADGRSLPLFKTGFLDHPTLFHHLQAGAIWAFGDSIVGLRMLSALFGAASVAPVYLIGRLGWGRIAGIGAAWLLAVSHLHIHFSRIALNNMQSSWFVVVAVALVMAAIVHGRSFRDAGEPLQPSMAIYVLFGLTIGLSQYFYYGARLLAVIAVPILVILITHRLARVRDAVAALSGALVPSLPLLLFYLDEVPAFMNRTRGVSVLNDQAAKAVLGPDATLPGDLPALLVEQVRRNLDFFFRSGDRSAFYTPQFPAFDSTTVLLFWLGIGVVAQQSFRRRPAASPAAIVVVVWLVSGILLGGVLTSDAPNAPRLLMAVPAVFVIGGAFLEFAHDTVRRLSSVHIRNVVFGALVILASLTSTSNYKRYFRDYPDVQSGGWVVELGELMANAPASDQIYLLGAPQLSVRYGTIRFIADGGTQRDVRSPAEFADFYAVDVRARKNVLVIAVPGRRSEFDEIVRSHPGGVLAERLDPRNGAVLWHSYELDHA